MKRIIIILAIIAIMAIDILIYLNQHLYYKSIDLEESGKKIDILEKANLFYPWNDLVYHELGKACFALVERNFGVKDKAISYLDSSIESFQRSIRINPSSQFSHIHYGKSLAYMDLLSPSEYPSFLEEYRKAALLVNHYNEIYYEVSKLYLIRWTELSDEDKKFTLVMLQKIWAGMDREKIQSLLQIWELNIKDYALIPQVLPNIAEAYRLYANYLGERSLDLSERQRLLTVSEKIEFDRARSNFSLGERDFYYRRLKDASVQFRRSLKSIEKIFFYQNLTSNILIEEQEITTLRKATLLKLAKCRIEEQANWSEIESFLLEYLNLEDNISSFGDLETYLVRRGLINERLDGTSEDLRRLAFHFYLSYKQHRYTDIVRVGRSLVAFPEEGLNYYIRILHIVGDSYQKKGNLFEADHFYRLALERNPQNLKTLLRIHQNLERLNDVVKIRNIDKQILEVLSPRSISPRRSQIHKGRSFRQKLLLDGRDIVLDLQFNINDGERAPLLTVLFNGEVVCEDYLGEGILSVPLETKVGNNTLELLAVNRPIEIIKLTWKPN